MPTLSDIKTSVSNAAHSVSKGSQAVGLSPILFGSIICIMILLPLLLIGHDSTIMMTVGGWLFVPYQWYLMVAMFYLSMGYGVFG